MTPGRRLQVYSKPTVSPSLVEPAAPPPNGRDGPGQGSPPIGRLRAPRAKSRGASEGVGGRGRLHAAGASASLAVALAEAGAKPPGIKFDSTGNRAVGCSNSAYVTGAPYFRSAA